MAEKIKSFPIFARVLFLLVTLMASSAAAQVPGELVPGRQHQEDQRMKPMLRGGPAFNIQRPPAIQPPPEGSEKIVFKLNEVIFDGVTAFDPARLIRETAQQQMGQEVSIVDVYEIAARVTALYVAEGYVLSFAFVPEQAIKNGIVRIYVVEGFVDKVDFKDEGDGQGLAKMAASLREDLSSFTRKIQASRPLKADDLQRAVFLLNDIPGMTAKAVFTASADVRNASNLTFYVSYRRVEATASADNHLSRSFDYYSYGGAVTLNGPLTGKDKLEVSARCGLSCRTYNAQSVMWSSYLGNDGLRLDISGAHSGTTPSNGILSNLSFTGSDKSLNFGLEYPLLRGQDKNLNLGFSLSWQNSETETFAGALTEDKITTANFRAGYDLVDKTGAVTWFNLGLVEGLPLFDATKDSDVLKSRANGSATFTNVTASVMRIQPLGMILPGMENYSVMFSANAQYAAGDPLLSSSQCYYGSVSLGRGYNSGAIGGDHCVMGIVELRRDLMLGSSYMQLYGFGDAGTVWRKGTLLAGEERKDTARSVGGGFRFSPTESLMSDFQVSFPLDDSLTANGKGTPKLRFSLTYKY